MSKQKFFEKFKEGEKIIETVQPGMMPYLFDWKFWAIILIGPLLAAMVALYFVPPYVLIFAYKVLIWIVLAIIIILLARILVTSYGTILVITTNRLLYHQRKGFLNKEITEFHYDHLQGVHYQTKGLRAHLIDMGTLKIEMLTARIIIIKHVPHAPEVQKTILELKKEHTHPSRPDYLEQIKEKHPDVSSKEIIDLLHKVLDHKSKSKEKDSDSEDTTEDKEDQENKQNQ